MKEFTLTVIDTRRIQSYIFATNSLRQNAGASYNVGCATRECVAKHLAGLKNNIVDINRGLYNDCHIEDGNIDVEVVYSGGGNAVLIFKDKSVAIKFTKEYTKDILINAPGLDITVVHKEFDWDTQALSDALKGLLRLGTINKSNRNFSHPMQGMAITAECAFSGLPASFMDKSIDNNDVGRLLSSEAYHKEIAEAKDWESLTRSISAGGYKFARKFSDIASDKGESSYIAVVHTDGNGMSKRINALRNKYGKSSDNRQFINEMRNFSFSMQEAIYESLDHTVEQLISSIEVQEKDGNEEKYIGGVIKINDDIIPFRPMVFSGDDVTFICEGRLALSLTKFYLSELEAKTLPDGKPFYGRAGIAVVKSHYPFARAYKLAEDLCQSAKMYISESDKVNTCAMDWHFAVNGPVGESISEIRKNEYTVDERKLYIRPIEITDENSIHAWSTFHTTVSEFKNSEQWKNKRNKIIALKKALRSGTNGVSNFLARYGLDKLPSIAGYKDMENEGWQCGVCGYFDAIEAMDFLVDLNGDGNK